MDVIQVMSAGEMAPLELEALPATQLNTLKNPAQAGAGVINR
jgi:hypothetical protein